jgi:hypothetical protein
VINLPLERIIEMTPAELGRHVLSDLIATRAWSAWNYINEAEQGQFRGEPARAIAGALAWLQGQGLIAHDPASGASWGAIVVTPAGRRAAAGK